MRKHAIFFVLLFVSCIVAAQRPNIKYGDVKIDDFKTTIYEIDSTANAVVLYDYCIAKYEGSNSADFNVLYKFHKRIRLINKNSFDLATISIPLYKGTNLEEKIEKLEAVTYNYENGNIVSSKIDKSSLFKDKVSKNYTYQKFTMPNIKEGSIIEYSYMLSSPFPRDLPDWNFQGNNPVLWSELDLTVPSIFNFVSLKQGYHPYTIDTISVSSDSYNILVPGDNAYERSEVVSLKTNTYHSIWAMQNVPALKRENYTTTLKNHIAKIEFQISSLRYPERPERPIMRTWMQVAEELMKSESFGADVNARNGWLTDDISKITQGAVSGYDKAKKVYEFLRDNFICTDPNATRLSSSIKKVFQTKNGNVADINLLLTAMLVHEGLDAAPALLSTKEHGKTYEAYPILSKFNYVICRLLIDSTVYLLDASQNKLGFGKLPEDCYNGSARLIAPYPTLINLSPSSLQEGKVTSIFISKGSKGEIDGSYTSNLGYYESMNLREKLVKTSKEDFFKSIKKSFVNETEVEKGDMENLKNYDEHVVVKYDFKMSTNGDDIYYFNPMVTEAYKTNPFKSAQRFYPVEMPYTTNETYVMSMEVPEGYKIDELPKSVRVKFNDDEGKFEYIVGQNNGAIQLRCTILLTKAVFMPEEYESLRNFFAYIVKKQSEQIVFKKIK